MDHAPEFGIEPHAGEQALKVTWFSEDVFRFQIGGKIVVLSPGHAMGVEAREVSSGADLVISGIEELDFVDATTWRPCRSASALDDPVESIPSAYRIQGGLLIAAADEPPLLLLRQASVRLGRWAKEAVVIPLGPDPMAIVMDMLRNTVPVLLLVREVDLERLDLDAVTAGLDGTAFQLLEAGMGIEFARR